MIEIFGKRVPTELGEMVEPGTTALLIIDMQNDSCSPGGATARCGGDLTMYRDAIPRIAAFSNVARRLGVQVIHVGMCSLADGQSDSPAWLRFRWRVNRSYGGEPDGLWTAFAPGSWGAEFVPELQPESGDIQIQKFRSSAFHNTNLDLILRANGIETVLVTGCETEGCVESTVRDLSFHDYFPIVLSDCVTSGVRELHEASLLVMGAYRADVVTSADVDEAWDTMGLVGPSPATEANTRI